MTNFVREIESGHIVLRANIQPITKLSSVWLHAKIYLQLTQRRAGCRLWEHVWVLSIGCHQLLTLMRASPWRLCEEQNEFPTRPGPSPPLKFVLKDQSLYCLIQLYREFLVLIRTENFSTAEINCVTIISYDWDNLIIPIYRSWNYDRCKCGLRRKWLTNEWSH